MHIDAGAGGVPNMATLIADELSSLAADAHTLAARVSPGEILRAVVLPSNGLTDLLDIGGLRVAAALPPSLLPGEAITVEVVGFDGDRINLQILPQPPVSSGPEPTAGPVAQLPPQAGRGGGTLGLTRGTTSPAAPKAGAPAAGARPVRVTADGPPSMGAASRPAFASASALRPGPAAPPQAPPAGVAARSGAAFESIEARLAAAHATNPGARPAPPTAARVPVPPAAGRGLAPPPNRALPPSAARAPVPAARVTARPVIPMRSTPAPPVAAPVRGIAAFTDPATLLRALRLPVTASNLAAARMAVDTPEKLPNALSVLERALANSSDPRVATLSTLASFVGRLDPRSPVFATQLAAFADHVVTGPEAKIAQLAAAPHADGPALANSAASLTPPTATERAAVVRVALDFDLKTQLLALAASSDSGSAAASPALERAVAGALTALTAVQLGAAAALAANPDGLAFAIPVTLPDGVARARVRIGRDAPERRGVPLDGDNFHIAFVLETRHLGTVAIELMTVGRAVTCSVKTEASLAQRAFAGALDGLTARLRSLKYTVAKAEAVVAPPAAAAPPAESVPEMPSAPVAGAARLVDTDA